MLEIAGGIILALVILGAVGGCITAFAEFNEVFGDWPLAIVIMVGGYALCIGMALWQSHTSPGELSGAEWLGVVGGFFAFVGVCGLVGWFEGRMQARCAEVAKRRHARRIARAICRHYDAHVLLTNRRRRAPGQQAHNRDPRAKPDSADSGLNLRSSVGNSEKEGAA